MVLFFAFPTRIGRNVKFVFKLPIKIGNGIITRQYDALNRVTKYINLSENMVQYAYYAACSPTTLTYPDGKAVHYTYDAINHMKTVTDWANYVTTYATPKINLE
ncbi:MAG: hypothetical protein ABF449_01670 [Ethanoligenens sp.]